MAKHFKGSDNARGGRGRTSDKSRRQPQRMKGKQETAHQPQRMKAVQEQPHTPKRMKPVQEKAHTPQRMKPKQEKVRQPKPAPAPAYEERMPYGMPAAYRSAFKEAAPGRDIFWDDMPVRGGIYAFLRGLLLTLAWIFRLAAIVLMALVVVYGLSLPVFRSTLATIMDTITSFLPWRDLGLLAVDTPYGGIFRGDLALIALLLFIMDWLLCRSRAALR